jgi:hypothetical protein
MISMLGRTSMSSRRAFFGIFALASLSGACALQACSSDEDSVITGQDDDAGGDGTASTSSSGGSSGTTNPPADGGGADALGDAPQATPLCNVDGGFGCVAPETCDPALGCVECNDNTQCAAGALKFCVRGECEQCSVPADCPGAAQTCQPRDHTCKASCTDGGANCGQRICDQTTGACVGCQTSTDCADNNNNNLCDPVTKQCVRCLANGDCTNANAKFCHPTELQCVQCLTHSACPKLDGGATQVCDPFDFRCRGGCFTNADCSGATPSCNQTTLRCGCTTNPDCAANPTSKFCSPGGSCVECLAAGDCTAKDAGFLQCSGNRCVGCLQKSDCVADPDLDECNVATGKCVECLDDTHCTQNPRRTCTNGACVK